MSVDWSTVQSALKAAVELITGIPSASVAWSDQDHPAGVRPYATLSAPEIPGTVTQAEIRNVAQVQRHTVEVTSSADGTYTITVGGVDHDFAAIGKTLTEIRDGLVVAFASSLEATASADPLNTDRLFVDALAAGVVLTIALSAGLGAITVGPYSLPTRDAIQIQSFALEELEVTVTISNRYDDAAPLVTQHARAMAAKVKAGVYLPSPHAILAAAGCPVIRTGSVLDLSVLLGAQYETRATVDLVCSVPAILAEEPGTIETAEIAGTYRDT